MHVLRSALMLTLPAAALLVGAACGGSSPESGEPAAEAAPKTPPPPKAMRAWNDSVGSITADVAPTIEALSEVLHPEAYTVRPAEDGVDGATVQVVHKGDVVLDIVPSEDGTAIRHAVSFHPHVIFPWGTKVGKRFGNHKHFDRMTCRMAEAPFEGRAFCHAYAKARVGFLISGWDGDRDTLPAKEVIAEQPIAGLVWTPHGWDDGTEATPEATPEGEEG